MPSLAQTAHRRRIFRYGSHGKTDRPPADQGHLVWAWDPDLGSGAAGALVGPAGTLSTPVYSGGPPAFYTFATTDKITFGDALDTTWVSALGFTLYVALKTGASLTASQDIVAKHQGGTTLREWTLWASANGVLKFDAFYGGGATNFDEYTTGVQLATATRYVLAVSFDPSQARAARCALYKNGSPVTITSAVPTGADGTIADTVALLTLGRDAANSRNAMDVVSYAYAYAGVHSAAQVAQNSAWISGSGKNWT